MRRSLRMASSRRFCRDCFRRGNHPTGWRSGFPTGRPWDFAQVAEESRAVPERRPGLPALPDPEPVPRIGRAFMAVAGLSARPGLNVPSIEGLSPRGSGTSLAATLTPIAHPAFFAPLGLGWPRRWPPVPAVPALACFARLTVRTGLRNRSLLQFRRSLSLSIYVRFSQSVTYIGLLATVSG